MTARINDAEWLRRQLGLDESSGEASKPGAPDAGENFDATTDMTDPADTGADQGSVTDSGEPAEASADGPQPGQGAGGGWLDKLDRKRMVRFGGLAAVGIVVVVLGATLMSGGSSKPAGDDPSARPAVITTAAPTPVAAEIAGVDRPLPFTASANCPTGSTSAQTLDGTDPTNAFVCVRNLVDGQVIRLDLPKTYVVTAISLTPGWIGKDSSGRSQWMQHRVVTRVQYVFNDTDRTMIMQDTGNVHGEAVQPVKHVLASKITMLILQTSRPPAETTAAPTPGAGLGPLGDGLFSGQGGAPSALPSLPPMPGFGGQATTDPVDATFAISRLKIIGHEAI
jgi:hypothetical protein